MSLTESQLASLEQFYDDHFGYAAQQIMVGGNTVFPLAADSGKDSYYSVRPSTRVHFADSGGDLADPEALVQTIEQQNKDSGQEDIVALMRLILGLASEFEQIADQDAEVSPLIYVMF